MLGLFQRIPYPLQIHGCLVYLPTWMVDLYGFNVGKYTRSHGFIRVSVSFSYPVHVGHLYMNPGLCFFRTNVHLKFIVGSFHVHPGRLTWNLKITQLKRNIIFQTIIFKFHVNLPGCIPFISSISCWAKGSTATSFKTASTWPMLRSCWWYIFEDTFFCRKYVGCDESQVPETQKGMLQIPWRYMYIYIYPISNSKNLWCTISHTPTSANVNPVKTNLRWAATIKNRTVCCIHQRWVSLWANWCTALYDHFLSCLKIMGVREWNNSQGCRKPNTHHNTAIYTCMSIYT